MGHVIWYTISLEAELSSLALLCDGQTLLSRRVLAVLATQRILRKRRCVNTLPGALLKAEEPQGRVTVAKSWQGDVTSHCPKVGTNQAKAKVSSPFFPC